MLLEEFFFPIRHHRVVVLELFLVVTPLLSQRLIDFLVFCHECLVGRHLISVISGRFFVDRPLPLIRLLEAVFRFLKLVFQLLMLGQKFIVHRCEGIFLLYLGGQVLLEVLHLLLKAHRLLLKALRRQSVYSCLCKSVVPGCTYSAVTVRFSS